MPDNTTRLGLPYMLGGDFATTIDDTNKAQMDALDGQVAVFVQTSHAARPAAGIEGRICKESDTGRVFYDDGDAWVELVTGGEQQLVPAAAILPFAGAAAPAGFLLCDGSAVSRSDYATLFTAIGTTYGTGDGSTTFNVPDLRGRVPVGADGVAGRLSANDALGKSGGEEKHLLTSLESGLRDHDHQEFQNTAGVQLGGTGINFEGTVTGGSPSALASDYIQSSGALNAVDAHNNMPPYQIVNHIIKT